MSFPFQYKIQVDGKLFENTLTNGLKIINDWTLFNTNSLKPSRWKLNIDGNLECTTSSHGMGGWINNAVKEPDYRFGISFALPDDGNLDIFGLVFRYKDPGNFYYLAWNGRYSWSPKPLRLYKMVNNIPSMMAAYECPLWQPRRTYRLDVQVIGNRIIIFKESINIIDIKDNSNTFPTGSYGFMSLAQPLTVAGIYEGRLIDQTLTATFDAEVDFLNKNKDSAKLLSNDNVYKLMLDTVTSYTSQRGMQPSAYTATSYQISSLDPTVIVFMNKNTPVTISTSGNEFIYGYTTLVPDIPKTPTELSGFQLNKQIIWIWKDNATNEDGYQWFNENNTMLMSFPAGTTQYIEEAIEGTYIRNVAAYNISGVSEHSNTVTIIVKFEDPEPEIPVDPDLHYNVHVPLEIINSSVVINPNDKSLIIQWKPNQSIPDTVSDKWSPDGYRIYDSENLLLIETHGRSYKSKMYLPGATINWTLCAYNVAGESDPALLKITFAENDKIIRFPLSPTNLEAGVEKLTVTLTWDYPSSEEITGFNIYNDFGEIMDIVKSENRTTTFDVTEYDHLYTFYMTAIRELYESNWSNMVDIKTDPEPILIIIEPEEPDNYPKKLAPFDREETDVFGAFKSGIGDGLDLLVSNDPTANRNEIFRYDLQLKGYIESKIKAYPKRFFDFRFIGDGTQEIKTYTGNIAGFLRIYPKEDLNFNLKAVAYSPTTINATINAAFKPYIQTPISFNYTITANCQKKVDMNFTNDKFDTTLGAGGPAIFEQVDGEGFIFDNAQNFITTTRNGSSDIYYPSMALNYTNYELTCLIKVDSETNDDDLIGMCFRVKDVHNYYALEWDGGGAHYDPQWPTTPEFSDAPLQLWKVVNNVPTCLYKVPLIRSFKWSPGVTYRIKLVLYGNSFTIDIEDISNPIAKQTLKYTDPSSTFMSGSFGPWAMSQGDVTWSNWLVSSLGHYTVEKTFSDTITDVNGSKLASKQLTTQTVKAIMDPFTEEERIIQGGTIDDWSVIGYSLVSDNSTIIFDVLNITAGSSVIKCWTTATTKSQNADEDSISKTLTGLTISTDTETLLSNETVTSLMNSIVTNYMTSKGYYSIDPITYTATTSTPDTAVNISDDHLYGQSNNIKYTASSNYQISIYGDQPESSLGPISGLHLFNGLGVQYSGLTTDIQYSIEPVYPYNAIIRIQGNYIYIKGTNYTDYSLPIEFIDGPSPIYRFIQAVDPLIIKGLDAHCTLNKTGGDANTFYYWSDNSEIHADGLTIATVMNSRTSFAASAIPKITIVPWHGETEVLHGEVNGKLPILKTGDGLKNFIIPINMDLPEGVDNVTYTVDLNDSNIKLRINGKTAIFSCTVLEDVTIRTPWYGTKKKSGYHKLNIGEVLIIKDKYISPQGPGTSSNDPKWNSTISDYCLIITSDNPNILIKLVEIPTNYVTRDYYVEIKLSAEIINPTQTAWSPMIHNGYYYLNQAEHFLYSNDIARGRPISDDEIRMVIFNYVLKANGQRTYLAKEILINDTNVGDFFIGEGQHLDIGNDLTLSKNNSSGSYISSDQYYLDYFPDNVYRLDVDLTCNNQSSVEISYLNAENNWTIINNHTTPTNVGKVLRYKLILKEGFYNNHSDKVNIVLAKDMNIGDNVANKNVANSNGFLMMLNTDLDEGIYVSKPIDLGTTLITNLGGLTVKYNSNSSDAPLEVYTITSDTPLGPWDGTGEPRIQCNINDGIIRSTIKRYIVFILIFKSSSKTITLSPDLMIESNLPVIKSPTVDGDHVTNWNTFTMSADMPPIGGLIQIKTRSASIEADLLMSNSIPVNGSVIMSDTNRFLVFDLDLMPGESINYDYYIMQPTSLNFDIPIGTNIIFNSNSKEIGLIDASEDGEYQSKIIDFTKQVKKFYPMEINNGNHSGINFETQTSVDGIVWSNRVSLNNLDEIVSPVNRYLRYFAHIIHGEDTISNVYDKVSLSGGAVVNITTFVDPITLISSANLTDPIYQGTITSGIYELGDNVSEITNISYDIESTVDKTDVVKLYAQTYDDPLLFTDDDWKEDLSSLSPKRFIRLRADLHSGGGIIDPTLKTMIMTDFNMYVSSSNITFNLNGTLTLSDPALPGEFISSINFDYSVNKWLELIYECIQGDATIQVSTKLLYDPDWSNVNGTAITLMAGSEIFYKISIIPTGAMMISPIINSVKVTAEVRVRQSPVIKNIKLHYDTLRFSSPILSTVKIGASIYDSIYPYVHSIKLDSIESYSMLAPIVESVGIVSNIYTIDSVSPVVHSVNWGAHSPEYKMDEEYSINGTTEIPADQALHSVSEYTAAELMNRYFKEMDIDTTNLFIPLTGYSAECNSSGTGVDINFEINENTNLIMASTTNRLSDTVIRQTKIRVEEDMAQISPIPQQGCPVIVMNPFDQPMVHVNFLDELGNISLVNTEVLIYTDSQIIPLCYRDIDPESKILTINGLDINGDILDSTLYLAHSYDPGTEITVSYSILNSFIIDYNYDIAGDYALLTFYKPSLDATNLIKVRCETNKDSAYYTGSEININPLINPINAGFIYLSNNYNPTVKLDVSFNPKTINANGYDKVSINIIALDKFNNPVVGDVIKLSVTQNGNKVNLLSDTVKTTDDYGTIMTILTSNMNTNELIFKAINQNGIESTHTIYQRLDVGKPKLSLNQIGNKITATLIHGSQDPAIDVLIEFKFEVITGSDFSLSKTIGITDVGGEDFTILSGNGIVKIIASALSFGLTESIISEVTSVV